MIETIVGSIAGISVMIIFFILKIIAHILTVTTKNQNVPLKRKLDL